MVDPGSAVGVVSLGIQVAQSLVKYYSEFKAYDKEIAHTIQHIERLWGTFAAFEVPLSRLQLENDSVSERVRISLNECKRELLNLEDVVRKCAEIRVPHTKSARMQRVKNKALYPFRRSTLVDVEKRVRRVQEDLDSAVQALKLKSSIDFQDRLENQITMVDQKVRLIEHGQLDVKNKLGTLQTESQYTTEQTGNATSRIDRNIESLMAQQQQMIQQFSTLMQITTAISEGKNISPGAVGEGILLSQEFGGSRPSLREQEKIGEYENSDSVPHFTFRRRCNCTWKRKIKQRSFFQKAVVLHWQGNPQHEPYCPLSKMTPLSDSIGVRIRSSALLFSYLLDFTVNCTRGAGGYSISQALACRRVVSDYNPAFHLLQPKYRHNRMPEASHSLEEIAKTLDKYLRDGTVSPTDITEFHGTLLQAACNFIAFDYPKSAKIPSTEEALKFLDFLIDAGVPVTPTYSSSSLNNRLSPLERLMYMPWEGNFEGSKYLCSYLLDQGSTWSVRNRRGCYFPAQFYMIRPDVLTPSLIEQGFTEAPILSAIMRKATSELKALLEKHHGPSSSLSAHFDLYEYLTACVGWPDGMNTVLDYVRVPDLSKAQRYPLLHALHVKEWKSFDLLCQFGFRITPTIFSFTVITGGEALRRVIELVLHQSCTWHRKHDGWDPDQLPPYVNDVFHIEMSTKTAEMLYDTGFRNVDGENVGQPPSEQFYNSGQPTTPLWKVARTIFGKTAKPNSEFGPKRSLKLGHWLIRKGARLSWLHPRFQTTPAHVIPIVLLCRIYLPRYSGQFSGSAMVRLANELLVLPRWWDFYIRTVTVPIKDFCRCACSVDGCLPVISSFKYSLLVSSLRASHIPKNQQWSKKAASKVVDEMLIWMDTLLSTSLDMANAVIRVITFEKLGIRHTCHEMALQSDGPLAEEDINETHDEYAELIVILDSLTIEFEDSYASNNDPSFYSFYRTYWRPRMKEVMQEMRIVTEEYVNGVQQAGVMLRPLGPKPPPGIESTYWDGWPSEEEENSGSESEEF